MFKRTKSPSPLLSSPSTALELHPRNPRVHRQSGIPSINRPRRLSGAVVANETNTPCIAKSSATKSSYQHPVLPRDSNLQTSTPSSHRRIASMPQPLPSVIQAQIDIDGDRIARGLISPPIVDFTRFDDQYRGPRNGYFEGLMTKMKKTKGRSHSIKPILKQNSFSGGVKNNNTILDPHPASARKPDPRLIVSTLEPFILDPLKKPADVLDVYDLLGMHQLDQLDFEEREIERGNSSGKPYPRGEMGKELQFFLDLATLLILFQWFSENLYEKLRSMHQRRWFWAGVNTNYRLLWLVVSRNCIVQVTYYSYNAGSFIHNLPSGIYQCNLFRTLPNRSRLLELINIFDSEQQPPGSIIRSRQSLPLKSSAKSGFGANTSLHLESTPDICALLSTYLSALPEPILLPALFRPIWDWCGMEEDEVDTSELKPFRRRMSSVSLSRTHTNPTESTRILIAQLVLHLLPSPHFSLLVYILAFFSQVAMVHEENGVGIEDLARMFGGRIFGGGQFRRRKISSEIAVEDPHQPKMEGQIMMCWFLRRWSPISEGLFDVVEDAKMGVFQDQQLQDRLKSLERKRCSVLIPLGDSLENGEIPNHSSGRDTPFRLPAPDDASHTSESPEISPQPHLPDESSLNTRLNSKCLKNNGSDEVVVDLDKSLDYGECVRRSQFSSSF